MKNFMNGNDVHTKIKRLKKKKIIILSDLKIYGPRLDCSRISVLIIFLFFFYFSFYFFLFEFRRFYEEGLEADTRLPYRWVRVINMRK